MAQIIATVATLLLLLASVLVVHFARREAAEIRRSTSDETQATREEARDLLSEAQRREERVAQREKEFSADHRTAQMYARSLDERAAVIARDEKRLHAERGEIDLLRERRLAEIGGLTPEEARAELMAQQVRKARDAASGELRRLERATKETADQRAREILVSSMQRQAARVASETSTTWIDLPSEEMKGRIIGREGRNIRAFESLTGVNVMVEEGVNAVQLSSFDVERREIAEVTLRDLIEDGRIQPQRVEAAYARAVADTEQRHLDAGLDAIDAAGVRGIPHEMVSVLGRLRLRSSYGQNVLAHLVESAQIAADIATSLGADVELARHAAFLHDIGKAFTHEREGTHAAIGAALAAEHGEPPTVVNAIAAHHDEVPQTTLEGVIVQVADAVSASRPGARREDVDGYLERMEGLERLVAEHEGVVKVLAMAAGREVRVVVEPETVDDEGTHELARTIAQHISRDFSFAGEIKVTVIRELRADAVAG
ncbi:ribonuclease Y [Demequina muriae]|uniref:Ribonuclease Y n=1 Tax=Demequina muriae TaxID=3051664 RepID=A0ABT8GDQ2_9MICO|nr:ribonuclease Y [Demequina sp. EGI L300058]MDN4479550.1 ribonuclease Y [Demequina sp. EGI L300058]